MKNILQKTFVVLFFLSHGLGVFGIEAPSWHYGHLKVRDFFGLERFDYDLEEKIVLLLEDTFPVRSKRSKVIERLTHIHLENGTPIKLTLEEEKIKIIFQSESDAKENSYYVHRNTYVVFEFSEQQLLKDIYTGSDFTLMPTEMKTLDPNKASEGISRSSASRNPSS